MPKRVTATATRKNKSKTSAVEKLTKAAEKAAQDAPVPKVSVTKKTESDSAKKDTSATETSKPAPRHRNRPFEEIFNEFQESLTSAYDSLKTVHLKFRSLRTAHNREVSKKITREVGTRTPTALFDQPLIDYFKERLTADELVFQRKEGNKQVKVDFSNMTTKTPLFRTDLTKLYNAVFQKHGILNKDDRRVVLYQNDPDLVELLTTGKYDAKYEEDIEKIRSGELEVNIFTIQKFFNHHIGKIDRPKTKKAPKPKVAKKN